MFILGTRLTVPDYNPHNSLWGEVLPIIHPTCEQPPAGLLRGSVDAKHTTLNYVLPGDQVTRYLVCFAQTLTVINLYALPDEQCHGHNTSLSNKVVWSMLSVRPKMPTRYMVPGTRVCGRLSVEQPSQPQPLAPNVKPPPRQSGSLFPFSSECPRVAGVHMLWLVYPVQGHAMALSTPLTALRCSISVVGLIPQSLYPSMIKTQHGHGNAVCLMSEGKPRLTFKHTRTLTIKSSNAENDVEFGIFS